VVVKLNACIDIQNLRFRYESGQEFCIDSLQLAAGSHSFLEGPSGSGKSTFLGLLSGILRPDSGTITVFDTELSKLSPAELDAFRANKVGYIFQRFNLIPHLSVSENIQLAGFFSRNRNIPEEHRQKMLRALGIEKIANSKASEISVGQAQRVAAARAFAQKPALLLADEPTSSLDQPMQEAFMNVLFELAKECGTTILFVSHNPQLASFFTSKLHLSDFMKASSV
jgi:putative ABC transport system ATP-binding protein